MPAWTLQQTGLQFCRHLLWWPSRRSFIFFSWFLVYPLPVAFTVKDQVLILATNRRCIWSGRWSAWMGWSFLCPGQLWCWPEIALFTSYSLYSTWLILFVLNKCLESSSLGLAGRPREHRSNEKHRQLWAPTRTGQDLSDHASGLSLSIPALPLPFPLERLGAPDASSLRSLCPWPSASQASWGEGGCWRRPTGGLTSFLSLLTAHSQPEDVFIFIKHAFPLQLICCCEEHVIFFNGSKALECFPSIPDYYFLMWHLTSIKAAFFFFVLQKHTRRTAFVI